MNRKTVIYIYNYIYINVPHLYHNQVVMVIRFLPLPRGYILILYPIDYIIGGVVMAIPLYPRQGPVLGPLPEDKADW